MKMIDVKKELPSCWSQHGNNYGSSYILGYTKYNKFEITQLWNIIQQDGTYKMFWKGDNIKGDDYITHWMPLSKCLN